LVLGAKNIIKKNCIVSNRKNSIVSNRKNGIVSTRKNGLVSTRKKGFVNNVINTYTKQILCYESKL